MWARKVWPWSCEGRRVAFISYLPSSNQTVVTWFRHSLSFTPVCLHSKSLGCAYAATALRHCLYLSLILSNHSHSHVSIKARDCTFPAYVNPHLSTAFHTKPAYKYNRHHATTFRPHPITHPATTTSNGFCTTSTNLPRREPGNTRQRQHRLVDAAQGLDTFTALTSRLSQSREAPERRPDAVTAGR